MIWLLTFCFLAIVSCTEPEVDDGVYILTTDNFKDFVASHSYTFIEFYAPWCGHCKQLQPVYAATAKVLKELNVDVPLAKVDCTTEKAICESIGVQGYPTLKLFKTSGDKIYDFEGERTQESIISFINKKTGPPSTLYSDAKELTSFLGNEKTKVVAYIEDTTPEYLVWTQVAQTSAIEQIPFVHVAKDIWGDKKAGTVELIVGKETFPFSGTFDAASITAHILLHGFPALEDLNQDTWNRAQQHPTNKVLVAFFLSDAQEIPEPIKAVAEAQRGKLVVTKSTSIQTLERWSGSGKFLPTVVLINFNGEQPTLFAWDEESTVEFNEAGITAFITESLAGTYKTNIKSEPIPEQDDDEPVKIIVGKTLDKFVDDVEKDVVLVEFYAAWCGHCKKLAPVYDELGAHFKNNDKVVIGKIDASINTIRKDIPIVGYPTIYAFVKGERHDYNGGHDLDSLVAFVEKFTGEKKSETEDKGEL